MNKKPTVEEFRTKVVDFMRNFEYTLSSYPQTVEGSRFRGYANKTLQKEIEKVIQGNNKEVERRYKYFVDYS
jgi:hypothetical protein